jgi:hypothetical protein
MTDRPRICPRDRVLFSALLPLGAPWPLIPPTNWDDQTTKALLRAGVVGAGGVEPPSSSVSANTGNRCTTARFPRSRSTVGTAVKCSHAALRASVMPRRSSPPPAAHQSSDRRLPAQTHSNVYLSTLPIPSSAFPHQPDPAHRTFRSAIALLSYPPTPTHESSAPRRRLDVGVSPCT